MLQPGRGWGLPHRKPDVPCKTGGGLSNSWEWALEAMQSREVQMFTLNSTHMTTSAALEQGHQELCCHADLCYTMCSASCLSAGTAGAQDHCAGCLPTRHTACTSVRLSLLQAAIHLGALPAPTPQGSPTAAATAPGFSAPLSRVPLPCGGQRVASAQPPAIHGRGAVSWRTGGR